MFKDGKKVSQKRGKKGSIALTQNLVIIIVILFLIGIVAYVIFKFAREKLVPMQ
jgi:hypothetical protein